MTRYVELYLRYLLEPTESQLSESARSRLRDLGDPRSSMFLPRQENFFFGSLQTVITARA